MGLRATLLKRSLTRYFNQPASVRSAMRVISGATLLSVLGSAILMRIVEPDEYPNLGVALWWAMQTVTTVGYGDVTPTSAIGRLIGAVVMLQSIAFITVVTAYITSSFVERLRHQQSAAARSDARDGEHRLHARFDELAARLDRLERTIDAARDQNQRHD
jgi:voltage-gated potassium channel